ncbi:hypothetical protein BDP27DRAFT_1368517 [Rhodocollybia butyracea]|uniref:Uncharacterized protein n=1 Tax=Rhodocollybia butyracea TaxID=206335 RepID=A0A9P5U0P3_9AGAR|nr:hypothetical protein BDP27DRAFT_1368517 [Rhodocollybia butyracea]
MKARYDTWLSRAAEFSRRWNEDDGTKIRAAKAWSKQLLTAVLHIQNGDIQALRRSFLRQTSDDFANTLARMENHYFVNDGFLRDGQLLEKQETDKIRHIPASWYKEDTMLFARYGVLLGHSSREIGIAKLLVATDKFANK